MWVVLGLWSADAGAQTLKIPRKPVIVIDAGHGGIDPGCIGPDGTQEKDLTLAVALALRDNLVATGHYKVIMTRDGDYFLQLHDRVRVAQQNHADLFISLHADTVGAASDPSQTHGASIYTISDRASDEVSARLAARENKADLLGPKAVEAKNPAVNNILLDLLSQETMTRSKTLAESVLDGFEAHHIVMLQRTHRSAGFAVLKGETFPSVLIEMGFLSSEQDSELLRDRAHQQDLAEAIAEGVDGFFSQDKLAGQ
jgi:N-acetylmuramoyl-L-alanine amidase